MLMVLFAVASPALVWLGWWLRPRSRDDLAERLSAQLSGAIVILGLWAGTMTFWLGMFALLG